MWNQGEKPAPRQLHKRLQPLSHSVKTLLLGIHLILPLSLKPSSTPEELPGVMAWKLSIFLLKQCSSCFVPRKDGTVQRVPQAFKYGCHVNLHKSKKIKNFKIGDAHTRPITVYSIFWRANTSAWMHTPASQQHAQSLLQEIAGVYCLRCSKGSWFL